MTASRRILKSRSLTNKMQHLGKSSILNIWLVCEYASGICKILSFSFLFCVHSFWFLTKILNLQKFQNYFWAKNLQPAHNQISNTYPFRVSGLKAKNVLLENVSRHVLRPNGSARLVIKNGKFVSVLILTVYSLLA